MKKGLKTKLGLSVASLALLAGTLSTTTYAWFTTNAVAEAAGITAQAEATSDSIYISTDGINFGASVTLDTTNAVLKAVTYDAEDGYVDLAGNPVAVVPGAKMADNKANQSAVLEFTLYFKTTVTTGGDIYIDINETSFTSSGSAATTLLRNAFAAGADDEDLVAALAAGKAYTGDILDATRFAIIQNGVITAASVVSSGDGANADQFTGTDKVVYHTAGATELGDVTEVEYGAKPYYENVMGTTLTNPYVAAQDPATENTDDNAGALANNTLVASGVTTGKIAKVTFQFYIEGWDADAFDTILGQSVQINLGFDLKSDEVKA